MAQSFIIPECESKTPITRLIKIGDGMCAFTEDAVIQVHPPETVDPDRTLPNPPWTQQKFYSHGTANPTIARVFIQATDSMKTIGLKEPEVEHLTELCWSMATEILQAQAQLEAIKPRHDEIAAIIDSKKLPFNGRVISPFPTIENLDQAAKAFLLASKSALQRLAQIYSQFFGANITNPRFDSILKHLKKEHPDCTELIALVEAEEPKVKKIVDLRNGIEHPTKDFKTIIQNFRLRAKGVYPPEWGHTEETLTNIYDDMQQIPIYLINICEAFFLLCLMWHAEGPLPYIANEIPENKRDASCPVRYEVEIDISFFRGPATPPHKSGS